MVISPLDIEVEGLEKVKESIETETQLYWERNKMIPRSFKLHIEARHLSPFELSKILPKEKVTLRLWLTEKYNNEKIGAVEEKKGRDDIIQEMKRNRFHEMELETLSYEIYGFDSIAQNLSDIGQCLNDQNYPVEYYKLGGTTEEENFELAVERLRNRITPGMSLEPPEEKSRLKINLEYEPSPQEEDGFLIRPAIFNPGRYYSKDEIKEEGQKIRNILDKEGFPVIK